MHPYSNHTFQNILDKGTTFAGCTEVHINIKIILYKNTLNCRNWYVVVHLLRPSIAYRVSVGFGNIYCRGTAKGGKVMMIPMTPEWQGPKKMWNIIGSVWVGGPV